MTYAELYGNIKKRPLKSGLGNKLIFSSIDMTNRLTENLGGDKFIKRASEMNNIMNDVEFNSGFKALSAADRAMESIKSVDGTVKGIEGCPLYK